MVRRIIHIVFGMTRLIVLFILFLLPQTAYTQTSTPVELGYDLIYKKENALLYLNTSAGENIAYPLQFPMIRGSFAPNAENFLFNQNGQICIGNQWLEVISCTPFDTDGGVWYSDPIWHPDSQSFWIKSAETDIWQVRVADGQIISTLSNAPLGQDTKVLFSDLAPSRQVAAFIDYESPSSLYLWDIQNNQLRQTLLYEEGVDLFHVVAFSPNEQFIAFTVTCLNRDECSNKLVIYNLDTQKVSQILVPDHNRIYSDLFWSNDSSKIAFYVFGDDLVYSTETVTYSLDTQQFQTISTSAAYGSEYNLIWSPDDQALVQGITGEGFPAEVSIVTLVGDKIMLVDPSEGVDLATLIAWVPKGWGIIIEP